MIEWSLQDAIDFVKQWETKGEMIDHKPAVDDETWNEVCVVFDICKSHGYDPQVVHEHMVSYFESGQQEPEDDEHYDAIYAGEEHGKPQYLSRKDALTVLEDSGFDAEVSKLLLSESKGNLAKALEIGTNMNLEKREAAGEFTPKDDTIPMETQNDPVVLDLEEDEEPLSAQPMNPPFKIPVVDGFDPTHVEKVVEDLEKEETQWDDDLLMRPLHQQFPPENPDSMQTLPFNVEELQIAESQCKTFPEHGLVELAAQKAFWGLGWRLRVAAYKTEYHTYMHAMLHIRLTATRYL